MKLPVLPKPQLRGCSGALVPSLLLTAAEGSAPLP